METVVTKNAKETQKIAKLLAEEIKNVKSGRALVIALEGELGAGKTTFTQGFMRSFGVQEKVLSPTFVLMKIYEVRKKKRHLVHVDCYRIHKASELTHLGFKELLRDRDAVILIEWADKVKTILHRNTIWITFEYGKKTGERIITIDTPHLIKNL